MMPAAFALAASLAFAAPSAPQSQAADELTRFDLRAEDQLRLADSLRALGYRPASLDLYGDAAHPLCASTWLRKSGPDWLYLQGLSAAELRDTLRALSRRGFAATLLSGTGASPLFAAVVERDSAPTLAMTGLDEAAFRQVCDSAQRNRSIPVWADAYGTAAHPLFAGVWRRNLDATPWNYSYGDDAASLPAKLEAFAPVWVRPALVVAVPGGRLFTVWQENSAGAFAFRAGIDGRALDDSLAAARARGLRPSCLSGGEKGFMVLLSEHPAPLPKRWIISGPAAPGLGAFDAYMRDLMQANQVRAGALAMVRDGRLVFAHGYTWAEVGYPETAPGSLFRIASCSKPLASMVLHGLLRESGRPQAPLSLQEKILALLKPAVPPVDARFLDITIDDLLTHAGGWIRSRANPDPVFNDYPVGSDIRKRLPESKRDFLGYMLGQPLQFAPGSQSNYANFGFFLIGRLLESLPPNLGKSYEQIAAEKLFKPLGLDKPRFGGSLLSERLPGEVLYHARTPYLQRARQSGGPPWVPGGYGDFDLRNMDAAGAWVLSAVDYAKILASFDLGDSNPVLTPQAVSTMWTSPRGSNVLRGWFGMQVRDGSGRMLAAKWHNGLFPGTSTLVFYRPDKWSFVLFLNRDLSPQLTGEKQGRELNRLADGISRWPAGDLFPALGVGGFACAKRGEASDSEACAFETPRSFEPRIGSANLGSVADAVLDGSNASLPIK